MKVHSFVQPAVALAITAMLSHDAIAQEVAEEGPTVSLGASYNILSNMGIDNSMAQEIGVGFRFNPRFSLSTVYSQFTSDRKQGGQSDVKILRADVAYDLKPWTGELTPYLISGIDYFRDNPEGGDQKTYDRVNIGVGLRQALSPRLSLQGDMRAVRVLEHKKTEGIFNVSLVWSFGSIAKATPTKPAPEPIAQPEPVEPPPAVVLILDEDQDGVTNLADFCLGTPKGVKVDATGCPPDKSIDLFFTFDVDSYAIRPENQKVINRMGQLLQQHPDLQMSISGHTDSTGTEKHNQQLSEKRAQALSQMLIEQFAIDENRLKIIGYGENAPIASNDTEEGQQQNRNVSASVLR